MSSGAQGRDAVTRQRGAWSFEPFATVEELDEIEAMQAELVALRAEVARLRGVARPVCYACDAAPVGTRDRRPEGGGIEAACARHADPVVALPAMPIDVEHERRVDEAIAKRAHVGEKRDRKTGRYVHTLDELCVCGHELGRHAAASSAGERECFAEGCECPRFVKRGYPSVTGRSPDGGRR